MEEIKGVKFGKSPPPIRRERGSGLVVSKVLRRLAESGDPEMYAEMQYSRKHIATTARRLGYKITARTLEDGRTIRFWLLGEVKEPSPGGEKVVMSNIFQKKHCDNEEKEGL